MQDPRRLDAADSHHRDHGGGRPAIGTSKKGSRKREIAVGHEKTQKAQRKERLAPADALSGRGMTLSTPQCSVCGFCAFLWPSTSGLSFMDLFARVVGLSRLHVKSGGQPGCGESTFFIS